MLLLHWGIVACQGADCRRRHLKQLGWVVFEFRAPVPLDRRHETFTSALCSSPPTSSSKIHGLVGAVLHDCLCCYRRCILLSAKRCRITPTLRAISPTPYTHPTLSIVLCVLYPRYVVGQRSILCCSTYIYIRSSRAFVMLCAIRFHISTTREAEMEKWKIGE